MPDIKYIDMTVSEMERAIAFYSQVLSFEKLSDIELYGTQWERLFGLFGLRMRVVKMQLGNEVISLTEYLTPKGRKIPADFRSNDRSFQHIAIVVSDMDKAYQHLRKYKFQHVSTAPQQLPDWNPDVGGVKAFYFQDPDGHNLELIQFPSDKIEEKWQQKDQSKLFLGIDHTAVVVANAAASIKFYCELIGLELMQQAQNYGTEHEHLSGVFGVKISINSLKANNGNGFEVLEYIAPTNGKPMPCDSCANDLWHYHTTMKVSDLEAIASKLRERSVRFISPGVVKLPSDELGFTKGLAIADLDGHVLHLVE
ncbi:VOC family protein [Myxosarcina sp. GI1]|uniref:VOC family protein n=1 Tax=Myxosarcina sp. GI1 TaxID=1541065 RepID=UPI00069158D5|nr:VOC family protein [Myxosarcina sp. GI1]